MNRGVVVVVVVVPGVVFSISIARVSVITTVCKSNTTSDVGLAEFTDRRKKKKEHTNNTRLVSRPQAEIGGTRV